jgi:hypothetical protein
MSHRRLGIALALLTVGLALPGVAVAAGPERFESTFTYTLDDAIADYQAFGDNEGDCGSFVLLIDYSVVRAVSVWSDREVRHVHYTGHFYSSAHPSRSIERGGDFNLTFWLDMNGEPIGLTRTGVFEYVVIDGRRVVTHVGRGEISFATGPISTTPKAGDGITEVACEALG